MWEVWLRERLTFNPIAVLYPLESGVQPVSICWTRCWQQAGSFELTLPAQTPYLEDLMALGGYIEIRDAETGTFEAIYIIEHAELQTGIINYVLDSSENVNAIYAGGQGTGTEKDCAYAENAVSIASMGRMEFYLDAREVEKDDAGLLALLIQRAQTEVNKTKPSGTVVAKAGEPSQDETVTVSGRSLLFWCAKRVVLPDPGTQAAGVVAITGADYDEITDAADAAMRHYVDHHLITPNDAARTVWNFVLGAPVAPLPAVTFQGRFGTVLDALQEIAVLNICGMEVVLNAADQFEFQVLPQVDRTWDSGNPVVFRSHEVLLDIPGRAYRTDWNIGDRVSLEVEDLGLMVGSGNPIDLTILAVTHTLAPETAPRVGISFDTPSVSDMERFRRTVTEGFAGNIKAARA